MKLIKDLGMRREYSSKYKNGVTRKWALFLCPICEEKVEKRVYQGLKNETCGCVKRTRCHDDYGTNLYNIWHGMKKRCRTKSTSRYNRYGGRGITYYKEWEEYKKFKEWSLANGYKNGLQIDRIDNDGNYEPSNCHFVTSAQNGQNRSDTKLNWAKVKFIRAVYGHGKFNGPTLAKMFGVTTTQIYYVKDNITWKTLSE